MDDLEKLKEEHGPPNERDEMRAKFEIIYGLLWLVRVDLTTVDGTAVSIARKTALEMIDKDGQGRGIRVAQIAVRSKIMHQR